MQSLQAIVFSLQISKTQLCLLNSDSLFFQPALSLESSVQKCSSYQTVNEFSPAVLYTTLFLWPGADVFLSKGPQLKLLLLRFVVFIVHASIQSLSSFFSETKCKPAKKIHGNVLLLKGKKNYQKKSLTSLFHQAIQLLNMCKIKYTIIQLTMFNP